MKNMIETAKRIVDCALKKGAEEAEVFIIKSEGRGFTIEKNSISSISGGVEQGIGIRILKNRKLGFAFCTEEEKAKSAVDKALMLSKLGKETEFAFPKPEELKKIDNIYDKRIIDYPAEVALEGAVSLIDSALEIDSDIIVSRGGLGYGSEYFVVANSMGLEVEDKGTGIHASINVVLRKNGMSTGFEDYSSRMLEIDFEAIGQKGAELAKSGLNAKKIENKEMTAIFAPDAFASLLEFITAPALYGEAVHKGESYYSGKEGEVVASKELLIIDDGSLPGGLNSAVVDDEGTPSRRTELLGEGVLKNFLYSQGSAIENNTETTANAMRAERYGRSRNYKAPPQVKARNIVVEGKANKTENLIGELEEGVLIYEILGAHTSNPASGDFSVNSPILFKIEKGEIAHPIKSAMLSGNFFECLNDVIDMGDEHKLVSGSLTPVSFFVPTISLGGVRFTG